MQLYLPQTLEVKGKRVLTSRQLAAAYGTDIKVIQNNFSRNKNRYEAGKHYIYMDRDELKDVKATCPQFEGVLSRTSRVHFWTEKGALLHAKSLNTDKAWEVYDYLVDYYFRSKEERKAPVAINTEVFTGNSKLNAITVVDVPENPEILNAIQKLEDDLTCMHVLLEQCKKYVDEKTYKERSNTAAEIVRVIRNDCRIFLEQKPKLIQKAY